MAQKVLELKATDGIKNSPDNSFFQTVFSEPISLKAGSSIDVKTCFIDIGNQAVGVIEVPTNLQLGIEFYRYEYDIGKTPTAWGTDGEVYSKRYIYTDGPIDYSNYIPYQGVQPPMPSTYGWKCSDYINSNLPSFLLQRTNSVINGTTRTETFMPIKETATILIPAGFYTKQKLTQIINDGFNLIQGSLTNADKPNEVITPNPPHPPNRAPLDYILPTNYTGNLLKVYQYTYAEGSVTGNDPLENPLFFTKNIIFTNDLTWPYWFFPIYTEPNPSTYYFNTNETWLPYVWMTDGQKGFLAGTTKINLGYDPENDNFFFDYTHTPIINTEGKEVVVFSRSKAVYNDDVNPSPKPDKFTAQTIGYKANGSMGGILISRLFSLELDANNQPVSQTNTGFWQNQMGFAFSDADAAQFEADMIESTFNLNFNTYDTSSFLTYYTSTINTFNIKYPNPKYLQTNTTDSLIPIQWLNQTNFTDPKNDYGMSIGIAADMPKVFESIGTRPIYSQKQVFSENISHFLIEINISHVRNDNFRDQNSYRQIMLIAGKTYSSGTNFLQTFDDGNIQALNLLEDITIDKIEIKIMNPDKTPATGLGTGTTIYLNLTEPIIVENKK